MPIPTAAADQAIRLQIPALSVDAPIVLGDGCRTTQRRQAGSGFGEPGENGNA
ncbi:MAG: hypothetical protein U0X92_11115 [Anaerolineales bacterium]